MSIRKDRSHVKATTCGRATERAVALADGLEGNG